MQATVSAGARLALIALGRPARKVPLRTLGDLPVRAGAQVMVLTTLEAVHVPHGQIRLTTRAGVATWRASVVNEQGRLLLRLDEHLGTDQRRRDVRHPMALDILIAAVDHHTDAPGPRVLAGRTVDVSSGGLQVRLEAPWQVHPIGVDDTADPSGAFVDAEITLSPQRRVRVVLEVVQTTDRTVRGSFVAIDPADQQHLDALVSAAT
ncbi:MAG: PilZ domain-containing protein [Angustibacter sp.]